MWHSLRLVSLQSSTSLRLRVKSSKIASRFTYYYTCGSRDLTREPDPDWEEHWDEDTLNMSVFIIMSRSPHLVSLQSSGPTRFRDSRACVRTCTRVCASAWVQPPTGGLMRISGMPNPTIHIPTITWLCQCVWKTTCTTNYWKQPMSITIYISKVYCLHTWSSPGYSCTCSPVIFDDDDEDRHAHIRELCLRTGGTTRERERLLRLRNKQKETQR